MRKILIVCGILVFAGGVAWQISAGTSGASSSFSGFSPQPVQSDPPPCPDLETCADSGCPHATNSCITVDTGLSSCMLSDGSIFSCNGNKTVHQKHCTCGTTAPCASISDAEPIFCK